MALNHNINMLYLLFLFIFSSLIHPSHLAQPKASRGPAKAPSAGDYVEDDIDYQQFSIARPPSSSQSPSMAPTADAPSNSITFDFSESLAPGSDVDPAVKKICDNTDHPSLCLSTVAPYLDGETDVEAVFDVSIQAGAQFSRYAQATAQKLAGNPGNPPQHGSVLNDCKDGFQRAGLNYGKAGDALSEKDKATVDSMLSAVITFVEDCQGKITKDSPLYNITDRLMNITDNCLAISSLVK